MNDENVCQNCGTSEKEIFETGFVGCEECYNLPNVRSAVEKMFKKNS